MKISVLGKGGAFIFFFLTMICLPLNATTNSKPAISAGLQQQVVSGIVADATGPMPGVSVILKGTNTSAVTDLQGHFSIQAQTGETLVFEYLGYKTLEVAVTGDNLGTILLTDNATSLQEVTINAGYYSVSQQKSTGSIAKITAKDIEKQPVTNMLATLQGRMPGVQVTQESGMPGGAFQIRIRGQNSLRPDGNTPLYIIDGIPYASDPIGYSQTSSATPSVTSPLNSINPSDIQSIEVLKDADATAIYGSRGANGVVLITTKKGKAGKTTVSVNSYTGAGSVVNFVDLMKTGQYLAMRRQAYANDGISNYPATAYDVNGTWDPNRYTDWQEELIGGTSRINSTQVALSGGSESTQFLISGTYYKESTVFPGNFGYQKGSLHYNLNHTSQNGKLKASLTGSYIAQNNHLPSTDLTSISRSIAPNAPALYDADGELNWEGGTFNNPLAALRSQVFTRTYDVITNGLISYTLLKGLEAKVSMGLTNLQTTELRTLPSTMYDPAYGVGSGDSMLMSNLTNRRSWIIEPQLNYQLGILGGELTALAGATLQQLNSNALYQRGYGFTSNSLIKDLASANQTLVLGSNQGIYKYAAVFGRLNYSWNDKYILNLTGRRDGSSRFGPGRQFANFGAVGAAWIFSRENIFGADNRILSFGKLRASYGTTGNDQIGDYQFLNTYASTGIPYQGTIGLTPTRLYNPDFGWEINKKLEFALEAGFLNDRIFLTAAYYRNRSSNQLVGIPLPGTTGFASINANLDATVLNKGFEFTLRTENIKSASLEWTSSFNLAMARNKLLSFPGLAGSSYANTYIIGKPITISRLYNYTGVDHTTGLYSFSDVNGDGVISYDKDRSVAADLTPEFFGGFQNQLRYKSWSLDFLLQFTKQKNYDFDAGVPAGQMYNQRNDADNAYNPSTGLGQYQVLTSGANGDAIQSYYNYTSSNAMIVDASFIRLKNISLSYRLPSEYIPGISCRLYLQGQNVLTFTPYKGADPEFRTSGFLPPLKVYSAGIDISF